MLLADLRLPLLEQAMQPSDSHIHHQLDPYAMASEGQSRLLNDRSITASTTENRDGGRPVGRRRQWPQREATGVRMKNHLRQFEANSFCLLWLNSRNQTEFTNGTESVKYANDLLDGFMFPPNGLHHAKTLTAA